MSKTSDYFFEEEFNANLYAAEQAFLEAEKEAELKNTVLKVSSHGDLILTNEND